MAKITYIKDGQDGNSQLILDGDHVDSSNFKIDSNVHAIQWEGSSGEIEYNDGKPNATITEIPFDLETQHATEKKANEDAEAKAEADRIANMTYADKREQEYPRVEDQLDDIYHNGIDGWKATIKAVKDKYPKE